MRSCSNNFDSLRIILALAVVLSHSFAISYGTNQHEFLYWITHGQMTLGRAAVTAFFVISGYLITQSFDRNPNTTTFVIARALRVWPALVVLILASAFVIGPSVSTLSAQDYFSFPSLILQYILVNLSLIDSLDRLPGVFTHSALPDTVNSSLWTLHVEVGCYVFVLALGVMKLLNRFIVLVFLFAGLCAVLFNFGGDRIELDTCFLGGMALYLWQPPLHAKLAALCAVLLAVTLLTLGFRFASATMGAYLIIYLALSPTVKLPNLAKWGDLSYGIYIWAFPIQQIVSMELGNQACWYLNLAISLPIILTVAWISWHFIESPALSLKKRIRYK